MKIAKLTYGLMVATMFSLASCDINDYPEFSDGDAFVAMLNSSASIVENDSVTTLEIPVMLTSLSGIDGTVDFTITPDSVASAIEGQHYTLVNDTKTLTFSKEAPTQYIMIRSIDNDIFGGDTKFTITLSNPQGAVLGANKTCVVTVEDDEHPLAFILGSFNGKGVSYFYDEEEWEARVEKDASDLSKVWITGLVPDTETPVYGIVNEEKTEVSIPIEQAIHPHSTYDIVLEAYHFVNGERGDGLETGENIIGKIDASGNISFPDYWIGAYAINKETGEGAGWWDLMKENVVLYKK